MIHFKVVEQFGTSWNDIDEKEYLRWLNFMLNDDSDDDCMAKLDVNLFEEDMPIIWNFFSNVKGKGHGSKLLEHTEKTLIDKGYQSVGLFVMADNVKAKKLYERFGYIDVNDGNLHGKSCYKMVKDLAV